MIILYYMPEKSFALPLTFTVLAMEASVLALTILYRHELFKQSINFIIYYQSSEDMPFLIGLYNLMSVLCSVFVIGFITFTHFFLKRKMVTLVLIYYLLLNVYLMAFQKQCYQYTRPFLFDTRIRLDDWSCQAGYGFPSGHSWVCFFIYQIVVSDLVGTKGWKKFFLLFVALMGVMNPLSRMYLGSHSGDQVLYGVFNSLVVSVLYRFFFQKSVYKLMKNALNGKYYSLILALNTIGFILIIIAPIIVYEINTRFRQYPQIYIDRFMQICQNTTTYPQIQREQGISVSIVGVPFGIIYGLLLSCKLSSMFEYTGQKTKTNLLYSYLVGNWNFGGCARIAKYLVVNVSFIVVFLVLFTTVLIMFVQNFYGKYFLSLFGFAGIGLSMTCFAPLLLIKWDAIEFVISRTQGSETQMRINKSEQI